MCSLGNDYKKLTLLLNLISLLSQTMKRNCFLKWFWDRWKILLFVHSRGLHCVLHCLSPLAFSFTSLWNTKLWPSLYLFWPCSDQSGDVDVLIRCSTLSFPFGWTAAIIPSICSLCNVCLLFHWGSMCVMPRLASSCTTFFSAWSGMSGWPHLKQRSQILDVRFYLFVAAGIQKVVCFKSPVRLVWWFISTPSDYF